MNANYPAECHMLGFPKSSPKLKLGDEDLEWERRLMNPPIAYDKSGKNQIPSVP